MLSLRSFTIARVAAFFALLLLAAHTAQAAEELGKLNIVTAVYGDLENEKTADVTQKVAGMVKGNSLSVAATPANFGDPAPNSVKKLKIGYTIDGVYRSKTVDEGETLDISTRLVVLKAVYGALPKGPSADVTEQVADLVRSNRLTVAANNENFGDPANNKVKQLRVDYTFDGVKKSKTVGEGDTLTLPEKVK